MSAARVRYRKRHFVTHHVCGFWRRLANGDGKLRRGKYASLRRRWCGPTACRSAGTVGASPITRVHITYAAAIAVSDSIHTNLQPYGFTNQGTVYVNLDSYGTYNLSSSQLQNFASHCHANGQKAGIYFTPFTYWGTLAQSSNQIAPGSGYHYSDILLRDHQRQRHFLRWRAGFGPDPSGNEGADSQSN